MEESGYRGRRNKIFTSDEVIALETEMMDKSGTVFEFFNDVDLDYTTYHRWATGSHFPRAKSARIFHKALNFDSKFDFLTEFYSPQKYVHRTEEVVNSQGIQGWDGVFNHYVNGLRDIYVKMNPVEKGRFLHGLEKIITEGKKKAETDRLLKIIVLC